MSISQYQPRADYIGTGIVDTYSFGFRVTDTNQVLVTVTDEDFVEIYSVRGNDPTYFTMTLADGYAGGEIVLTSPLNAGYLLTILLDDQEPVQTTEFKNKSQFTLSKLEAMVDRQASYIQRLTYVVARCFRLPDTMNISDAADFNTKFPINSIDENIQDNANKLMMIGPDNKSLALGPTISDLLNSLVAASSGLPLGGDQYALLEKLSAMPGDAVWTDALVYDGVSARFGSTQFTASGIKAILDAIIQITYTAATITLSGSSNTLREKGDSVASITLTATTVKKSNDIGEVRFYRQPSTLLDTQTSGGGIPSGGVNTYNYSTPFSDVTSFRAEVDDILADGNGPTTTVSNTVTYNFVYPYYYGGGSAGLGAGVAALTKHITTNTNNYSQTITATSGQKLYVAYPASYGALTSILDVNNFEVISAFSSTTANITGLDGNAVSYRIYEAINPVVAGSYFFQFKK